MHACMHDLPGCMRWPLFAACCEVSSLRHVRLQKASPCSVSRVQPQKFARSTAEGYPYFLCITLYGVRIPMIMTERDDAADKKATMGAWFQSRKPRA